MKDKNFIEQEKEDFNQGAENEFYDYIQMGPLEEEILYEFHFDVEQFRRYLQKQKQKNKGFPTKALILILTEKGV